MNRKFKKITAILMSALIISSVATLTACTDTSTDDKNKATEASTEVNTEGKRTLSSESKEDGIYVEGVFPEDAKLYSNFMDDYPDPTVPLFISQYWYKNWFEPNNKTPKFYEEYFRVSVNSEEYEYDYKPELKVFVPYDKPDRHIVYFDYEKNPKEIPSEYINGKYVFSLDPKDFEYVPYGPFYICNYGDPADPNAEPVQQTLTDEETGVTVSGEILPDTQLMVVDYSNNPTLASEEVTTPGLYYIALIRGNKEITPSTPLKVTIPGEADSKVGYYHPDKFNDRILKSVSSYHFESADVEEFYIPVVDENDTQEELTYLDSSYTDNIYTITTDQLGMFGVGTEDKLNPEYLCRVDFGAPT